MTRHNSRLGATAAIGDIQQDVSTSIRGYCGQQRSNANPAAVSQLIQRLQQDMLDVKQFYSIKISSKRHNRVHQVLEEAGHDLKTISFDDLDQDGKVDGLLLRTFLDRQLQELEFEKKRIVKIQPLLKGWADAVITFCQQRQAVVDVKWQQAADDLDASRRNAQLLTAHIVNGEFKWTETPSIADTAVRVIAELKQHLAEAFSFYRGYHPLATWWLQVPCEALRLQLEQLQGAIRRDLVGVEPGDEDAIIGDAIGREALLADLRSESLAYTPEELIQIGKNEYRWCEAEMIKASQELGYGKDWRKALEHVKNMFVEPGEQILLVQKLAREAVEYVRKHDLVTVPWVCEEARKTLMMTPEAQKANPFFLGGTEIIVSYPTDEMEHRAKLMSMRGNAVPFSKATVFHELIPGHHLQFHYISRYRTYRTALFDTPFWMEGWALYWEFMLWERGDFFTTPEDRIGTLFWRMHRCARIIFSIKFHLGEMTPQECVDYLVEKVGHERATAEGEVRRSFNGDYRPLYQAGYMLGALQIRALRQELVATGKMKEKIFHDEFLKSNEMSIDMIRALLSRSSLKSDYKPSWRFYDPEWHAWSL